MKKGPRTRKSNRSVLESSALEKVPPVQDGVFKKPSKRRRILKGERENTIGLAILPDELLLEILSYYPESEVDPKDEHSKEEADAHFARRERLIALSQTCRNLRRFLRPCVWRRIEVFIGMRVSTGEVLDTPEKLALELIRQLEIVTIRDPELANYVNVVNIMIGDYCVRNVLRELARCLEIFPNMHTLKLDHKISTAYNLDQVITYGFGRHKPFPQIRFVTLPPDCEALLRYVPSVRYIYPIGRNKHQLEGRLLEFSTCCPLLENLFLSVPSIIEPLIPDIARQFPHIGDLTLQFHYVSNWTQIDLNFILLFRRLRVIRMDGSAWLEPTKLESFKSQVKGALLDLQKGDKKEKTIVLRTLSQPEKIITLPWPPIFTL